MKDRNVVHPVPKRNTQHDVGGEKGPKNAPDRLGSDLSEIQGTRDCASTGRVTLYSPSSDDGVDVRCHHLHNGTDKTDVSPNAICDLLYDSHDHQGPSST